MSKTYRNRSKTLRWPVKNFILPIYRREES